MLSVKKIESKLTYPFLLNIHYAKRIPSISYAYGLFDADELIGVVTFGSPASPFLCKGLLGEEHKTKVIELNRLCLKYNRKNEASFLVSKAIKMLPTPKAIVSYADTKQNHLGVIYQATNFIFTGTTKPRTDMASDDGKHSRHNLGDSTKRVDRSAKHRYVYFHGNKYEKKEMLLNLKYKIEDYPKGSKNA
jgi:hypothetical protein